MFYALIVFFLGLKNVCFIFLIYVIAKKKVLHYLCIKSKFYSISQAPPLH